MNKDTAQKVLKIFGVIDYIFGILTALLAIVFFANIIPEFNTEIMKTIEVDLHGIQPNILYGTVLLVQGLVTVFEGWALCRAAKDSNKTTLALVLTILSLIGGVCGLFTGSIGVTKIMTVLLDLLTVYAVTVVRKEA